ENVRSCDYYEATCFKNEKLLIQLYFGTTYPTFRKRILKVLGGVEKLPTQYQWSFFRPTLANSPIVNLHNGQSNLGPSWLKEGQIPQRLLLALSQDFYKPMRVSELHELLYPKEYYHPTSSPDRIHQALRRLRHWFQKNHISLEIKEDSGFYSLTSSHGCTICLTRDTPAHALSYKMQQHLRQLQDHFKTRLIVAAEGAQILGVSHRSTIRILNQMCVHGPLERIGKGPRTCYRINYKGPNLINDDENP
ncbi:MAG: hypothetical protein AABY86_12160, partial [Bdellovibrionota bacterium]